jgi:hypothetical protein
MANLAPNLEPARDKWLAACDAFEMADADLNASGDSDAEIDFYSDAQRTAIKALALTPAPDLPALVRKLDVLANDGIIEACADHYNFAIDAVLADARRLAGMGA